MTDRGRAEAAAALVAGRGQRRFASAELNLVGLALVICGVALVVSAAADLTGGASDAAVLLGIGIGSAVSGLVLRTRFPLPERITPRSSLRTAAAALGAMIAVSTVVYLATGAIDGLQSASIESTSGFTTTALSVIGDPELQPRGVLFWRASTQWIGGFTALATIIAVLPFLGVSGPADPQTRLPTGVSHLTSGHVRRLLGRYALLYLILSLVGALVFLIGGMGPFDATTYAFTTISTGGFANHDGSFSRFDSELLEWMGVLGMALGGLSLSVVWSALRGHTQRVFGARELWAYAGLLVGSTAVIAVVQSPGDGLRENLRLSAFTATSAVSSTGHWVTDWSSFEPGLQMMLVLLIGIGAMSGSVGGGFRIVRAMALFSFLWRELVTQLQPRLVRSVRVGPEVVSEPMATRILGYQALYVGTAAAGFLGLAAAGTDVVTALSGSVSALATYGPALGELGVGEPVSALGGGAMAVLGFLMFAGRIELYPLLDGLVWILFAPLRRVRRASFSWAPSLRSPARRRSGT